MSDTMLVVTENRDERIRECAYHLWAAGGRPHGRDDEFWQRAEELIGMEDNAAPGRLTGQGDRPQSPAPRTRSRGIAKPKQSRKKL